MQTKFTDMKYLLMMLMLVACQEIRYEHTKVQVTGIEEDGKQCRYQVEAVVPYRPYIAKSIVDACGKHKVGDTFEVTWVAN